jgi:hypothetical protein
MTVDVERTYKQALGTVQPLTLQNWEDAEVNHEKYR